MCPVTCDSLEVLQPAVHLVIQTNFVKVGVFLKGIYCQDLSPWPKVEWFEYLKSWMLLASQSDLPTSLDACSLRLRQ